MPTVICLKVPKRLGEQSIRLVKEIELLNPNLQISQTENWLLIPLVAEPSTDALIKLKKLKPFELSLCDLPERQKRHTTHIEALEYKLQPTQLKRVPRAIDFVGDIAIVEVPDELSGYKKEIGQAILKSHKQTVTVLAKSGIVEGVYRIRDLEVIAGENKTTTMYKEYDCQYHVDVAKAFFSPRLSTEHNRVASLVKEGETVIDLFAGVGPFVIPIAKKQKNMQVYAIDINPDAVALLRRNIVLNRVEKQVVPILGDAREIVKNNLLGKADQVIMNLPETGVEFVDVACDAIKPEGGIIHYYCFVKNSKPLEIAKVQLVKAVNKNNRQVTSFLSTKTVREVSPYTYQVVVDALIQ
ncbi:class I SAM-dependent methyltransferase family protein [Candidatus Bathyarchaeota archaeon]|nr:class I SAM-dependent methyltransferase family protein [Candidatus Bathyarchaeota archaeon]